MAHPFLFLVLPMAAGMLAAGILPLSPAAHAAGMAFFLAGAWTAYSTRRRLSAVLALLGAAVFFLGAGIQAHTARRYAANPLVLFQEKEYADFEGILERSPERGKEADRLYIRVQTIHRRGNETPAPGRLRVTIPHGTESGRVRNLLTGDRLRISARLSDPVEYRNFQPPSYPLYLKTIGLHRTAFTKSALLIEKLAGGGELAPGRLISRIRRKLQDLIEVHFTGEGSGLTVEGGVLEALLLGARQRMDAGLTRSLQDSGLYHLFAISGAHIALLAFGMFTALRLIRIGGRLSSLILIAFLVFFAALVEGRPSVLRATVMTVAYLLGKLLWKDVSLLNILGLSAFFLLLTNPFNLRSVGFQLTFAATLAIILFFPRIIRVLPRLPLRISEILAVSLCAQLGALPIMAAVFNRVALAGLVLNLAALPLLTLIMAGGYLFVSAAFISPGAGAIPVQAIEFLIGLLKGTSDLAGAFGLLTTRVPTPHALTLIAYILLLSALLLPLKRRIRWIPSVLFPIALAILITYPFPAVSRDLRITFIDVGQGDAILVEFPGSRKLLIDGGGGRFGTFDIGEQVVSPFLWRKGIKRIDTLALSHAHPDHMGGLTAVARNFSISEFWESDRTGEDAAYRAFSTSLPDGLARKRLHRGDAVTIGETRVVICHPEPPPLAEAMEENDLSLVLHLTHGQVSFLFTGDVEAAAEASMLEGEFNLRARVMKSPHHGSRSSSTPALLRAVNPGVVVISVGKNNRYGLPHPMVLDRYVKAGAAVYRTDLHGAVEITTDGRGLVVRSATGAPPLN